MRVDLLWYPGKVLLLLVGVGAAQAAEPTANARVRLDRAEVVGRRWDVPLGYDPESK